MANQKRNNFTGAGASRRAMQLTHLPILSVSSGGFSNIKGVTCTSPVLLEVDGVSWIVNLKGMHAVKSISTHYGCAPRKKSNAARVAATVKVLDDNVVSTQPILVATEGGDFLKIGPSGASFISVAGTC